MDKILFLKLIHRVGQRDLGHSLVDCTKLTSISKQFSHLSIYNQFVCEYKYFMGKIFITNHADLAYKLLYFNCCSLYSNCNPMCDANYFLMQTLFWKWKYSKASSIFVLKHPSCTTLQRSLNCGM